MIYFIKCPKDTFHHKFALLKKTTLGTFITYVSRDDIQEGRITDPKRSSLEWWRITTEPVNYIDESLVPVKVLK